MEISRIDVVNSNVIEYVDYVFRNFTSGQGLPEEGRVYSDWFINDLLPAGITRWQDTSCYDINSIFTIEHFFDNNICLFSDVLQLLSEHFTDYDDTMISDKFDPKNVMRCYTSVYVSKHLLYFLDRYRDEYNDLSNPRDVLSDDGNTSDILSLDLFHPVENTVVSLPAVVNIIGNDDDDEDDNTTVEDNEDEISFPRLPRLNDDETDTSSLPALLDYDSEDEDNYDELYDTGVFVSENEFIEKNKNMECIICWEVVMDYTNSMKWNNCDHFTCISCHNECKNKRLNKCPLCRA
jgi:hypothetical protein